MNKPSLCSSYLLPFLALSFLVGCAGPLRFSALPTQTYVSYQVNQAKEVSVGDPMVEVERTSMYEAYVAQFDCQAPSIGIPATPMILIHKGDRFTAVASMPGSVNERALCPEGSDDKSIAISIYADGRVKNGWVLPNGMSVVQGKWPTKPLFAKSNTASRGEQSYKVALVYSGISGSTIQIACREYENDYDRPASSQDLRYDLNASKTIAYKSLKIEVTKATNSSIQYAVKADGGLLWMQH